MPITDIKSNWSLFAIVAVILAGIVYILYKSGIFDLANTLSDDISGLTDALKKPIQDVGDLASSVTSAPSTLLGGNTSPVIVNNPDVGTITTPGDSPLLWSGVKNLFTTGSIYGNQGN